MKLSASSTNFKNRTLCLQRNEHIRFLYRNRSLVGFNQRGEEIMFETMSAILSGILLVILSMLAGGVIYFLLRDFLKSHIRNKD